MFVNIEKAKAAVKALMSPQRPESSNSTHHQFLTPEEDTPGEDIKQSSSELEKAKTRVKELQSEIAQLEERMLFLTDQISLIKNSKKTKSRSLSPEAQAIKAKIAPLFRRQ